jgi:hypothetical protein
VNDQGRSPTEAERQLAQGEPMETGGPPDRRKARRRQSDRLIGMKPSEVEEDAKTDPAEAPPAPESPTEGGA